MTTTSKPPGPRGHWLSGNLPEYRQGPLQFLTCCAREHGDTVALRFAHRPLLLINHPDLIEQVLVTKNQLYRKHFALRLNPLLLGNGLLTSESDFWLRQRRLVQPAFNRSRIAAYVPVMVEATRRMLNEWQPGQERDIHMEMRRLTLAIAAKTLFDADADDGEAQEIADALEISGDRFMARFQGAIPWPLWLPTPGNLRLKSAVRKLDAILYRFIRQRRQNLAGRGALDGKSALHGGDLLSLLLKARDEGDGQSMTDKQVRDEAMTLFLAGHETTALALSWAWYLIAQNPRVQEKMLEECDSLVFDGAPAVARQNGESQSGTPTFDGIGRLHYVEAVAMETMRLYPPAYVIGREALQETTLGDYRVKKGMTVLMSQWVVQRDPRYFDEPEEFRPERWLNDGIKKLPKFAYFPFGGGPRLCVGNTFAMMEMVLILALLVRQFRMNLVPGREVVPAASFTLHPMPGIPAIVEPRRR